MPKHVYLCENKLHIKIFKTLKSNNVKRNLAITVKNIIVDTTIKWSKWPFSGADLSLLLCYFQYFFLGNHIVNLLSTKVYFIVNLLSTKSTTFSNSWIFLWFPAFEYFPEVVIDGVCFYSNLCTVEEFVGRADTPQTTLPPARTCPPLAEKCPFRIGQFQVFLWRQILF